MHPTGDQQLLKGLNRMAIVRSLCAQPGLSRAAVAEAVGLTKSTVSLLVRELVDDGWLTEQEVVATGDLGRRPTPLLISPLRLVLLGAELEVEQLRVVATTLTGEVLLRHAEPLQPERGPQACVERLAALLQQAAAALPGAQRRVIGIGVGLPGGVDEASGELHFAPNLGWRQVPVGALLAAQFAAGPLQGVPLFVQNEADVAALGELEFAPAPRPAPLLYISLNQGVGAGVIVDDRLLTGAHGFAGEVGHTILQLDGPACSCGRRGCAEALIGLRAMLPARARSAAGVPLLQAVQQRLQRRQAGTADAVAQAGRYLGLLLQNLNAAYDPGAIVLGGASVQLGDAFLQPALQTLQAYSAAAGLPPPPVTLSRFGDEAVAVGAAALARYRLTRPLLNGTRASTGPSDHQAAA